MVHSDLIVKNKTRFKVKMKSVDPKGNVKKAALMPPVPAGKEGQAHLTPKPGFLGIEKGVGATYHLELLDKGKKVGSLRAIINVPACGDNKFELEWVQRPAGMGAIATHLGKGGRSNAHRHEIVLNMGQERLQHNTPDNNLRSFEAVPFVGSGIAIGHHAAGSDSQAERAWIAQRDCIDAIPGAGHLKGLVHYATGDTEGGDKAMKAATRTAAVLGAGALTGGVGAVGAGLAMDGLYTGVESALAGEFRGEGILGVAQRAAEGDLCWSEGVLGVAGLGMDAIGGAGARRAVQRRGHRAETYNQRPYEASRHRVWSGDEAAALDHVRRGGVDEGIYVRQRNGRFRILDHEDINLLYDEPGPWEGRAVGHTSLVGPNEPVLAAGEVNGGMLNNRSGHFRIPGDANRAGVGRLMRGIYAADGGFGEAMQTPFMRGAPPPLNPMLQAMMFAGAHGHFAHTGPDMDHLHFLALAAHGHSFAHRFYR